MNDLHGYFVITASDSDNRSMLNYQGRINR